MIDIYNVQSLLDDSEGTPTKHLHLMSQSMLVNSHLSTEESTFVSSRASLVLDQVNTQGLEQLRWLKSDDAVPALVPPRHSWPRQATKLVRRSCPHLVIKFVLLGLKPSSKLLCTFETELPSNSILTWSYIPNSDVMIPIS